jgi:hypothetical protein
LVIFGQAAIMQRMTKTPAPEADEIFTLDEVSAYLKAGKRTVLLAPTEN